MHRNSKNIRIFAVPNQNLDVAQLAAHLVRDQEVEGSSPFIQTKAMAGIKLIPAIARFMLSTIYIDEGLIIWTNNPVKKSLNMLSL